MMQEIQPQNQQTFQQFPINTASPNNAQYLNKTYNNGFQNGTSQATSQNSMQFNKLPSIENKAENVGNQGQMYNGNNGQGIVYSQTISMNQPLQRLHEHHPILSSNGLLALSSKLETMNLNNNKREQGNHSTNDKKNNAPGLITTYQLKMNLQQQQQQHMMMMAQFQQELSQDKTITLNQDNPYFRVPKLDESVLKNNLFLNNNMRKARGTNGSKLKKSDMTAHHQNIVFSTQPNHRQKQNVFKNQLLQIESPGNPGKGIQHNKGGHLFSYNEIRDHKITLNSIRRHIQKAQVYENQFQPLHEQQQDIMSGLVIQNLIAASPSEKRLKNAQKQQEVEYKQIQLYLTNQDYQNAVIRGHHHAWVKHDTAGGVLLNGMISNIQAQQIQQQNSDEKKKPISRGDAALNSFVGTQHREKIKKLYAQTDQILQDTLNQGSLYVHSYPDEYSDEKLKVEDQSSGFHRTQEEQRTTNDSIFDPLRDQLDQPYSQQDMINQYKIQEQQLPQINPRKQYCNTQSQLERSFKRGGSIESKSNRSRVKGDQLNPGNSEDKTSTVVSGQTVSCSINSQANNGGSIKIQKDGFKRIQTIKTNNIILSNSNDSKLGGNSKLQKQMTQKAKDINQNKVNLKGEPNHTIKESFSEENLETKGMTESKDNLPLVSPIQQLPQNNPKPVRRMPNPYEEYMREQEKILQQRKDAKEKYSKISSNILMKGSQPFKFIIKEGNNHQIVQRIMKLRVQVQDNTIWEETPQYDSLFNFKWQPISYGIKYDQLSKYGQKQLVNHIEGHENITTKDQLFLNLKYYCEKTNLNVFDSVPLTFILDFKSETIFDQIDTLRNVHKIIESNLAISTNELNKKLSHYQNVVERRGHQSKNSYKLMESANGGMNMWLLKPTGLNRGRGIHIFRSFDELKDILYEHYDINWFNQTYAKPQQIQQPKPSVLDVNNTINPLFLQKEESQDSNTQPVNGEEKVQNAAVQSQQQQQQQQQQQTKFRSFAFVVQKYLEKPLLFKQRKFDLRVWMFISFDFKCYLFRECYVRTSCEDYDLEQENMDKIYIHLTNNAIQKNSDNYGKFEDGNQISLGELSDHLAETNRSDGMSGAELKQYLESQYRQLILQSLKAVKGKLKIRKYTYELMGYDFIIDENLKTYLIEVNTNPCIEESSQLLKMLLPRMLDDLFKLTLDVLFLPQTQLNINNTQSVIQNQSIIQTTQQQIIPPTTAQQQSSQSQNLNQQPQKSQFPVTGYDDNINMWEQIYTLN